jgi:Ca2+-binding EF-hand superfamily protein
MKYWKAGLAGALVILPLAAIAAGPHGDGPGDDGPRWGRHGGHGFGGGRMIEMLQGMDGDRNGVISADEFRTGHEDRLSDVDTDGDGRVTLEEMETRAIERVREHIGERFSRLDADGDGAVSAEEFAAQTDQRFARMDRDEDGNLTIHDMPARGHGGPDGADDMPEPEEAPAE